MRCSRRLPFVLACWTAMAAAWSGSLASPALGQTGPRLGQDLIAAEQLDAEAQRQIASYVDHWGDLLIEGGDAEVLRARAQLREPLTASERSAAFLDRYSRQVAQQLAPALDSDRLIVRMNAMIVANRLQGPHAMPLIERGMEDEAAAVRYWAMKAIRDISLPAQETTALLRRLIEFVEQEDESAVLEQTLLALVNLDSPQAQLRGLEILNDRVARHAEQPGRSLQAEAAAMRQVYRQLAEGNADGRALVELARAAIRYQDFASRALQADEAGEVDSAERETYIGMIRLSDSTLRWVHQALEAGQPQASVEPLVGREDWAAVQRHVSNWRSTMQGPPYNLQEQDLLAGS